MKKFKSLGKLLSRTEQKKVIGGDYDDEILPCGTGRVATCFCRGNETVKWHCCVPCPSGVLDENSCVEGTGCSTSNMICGWTSC